jgi:excisionase family DNA binding protein
MEQNNAVLNIEQLSQYLNVPKSTLYRLVRENRIPSHKVGKHWRFRKEAVDLWLDRPSNRDVRP